MREKLRKHLAGAPWLVSVLKAAYRQRVRVRRFLKPFWLYRLLRLKKPLSDCYGFDRGTPIDRYYIEGFLEQHRRLITGRCLEVLNANYIKKFGQNVSDYDILDIDQSNKRATVFDDLRRLTNIADNSYDCIILTQVLQFIDRTDDAVRELWRILKPGGTVLASVPAISRIDVRSGIEADFWRFAPAGVRFLFGNIFEADRVTITALGNCQAGLGFWVGASVEEFSKKQLDYRDPNFPCVICIKATKK